MDDLLLQTLSPEAGIRQHAEKQLSTGFQVNPSAATAQLLQLATNDKGPRQSALLYFKRAIPQFWSAAFQSFTGPAISQPIKKQARDLLLQLVSDSDNKVSNAAIYCVVQIAAVEFPDEWPTLLDSIFAMFESEQISGGLALLQELFDDIITEELFFGGAGPAVMEKCLQLLSSNSSEDEIKIHATRLYSSCLVMLQGPEVLDDEAKVSALKSHFQQICPLLVTLMGNARSLELKKVLAIACSTIIGEFPEGVAPAEFISQVHGQLVQDLAASTEHAVTDSDYKTLIVEQLQLLLTVSVQSAKTDTSTSLLQSLLRASQLSTEREDDYLADMNEFVIDETGTSTDFTPRSAIFEYITECDARDFEQIFPWIWDGVKSLSKNSSGDEWRQKEALLYLFKCSSMRSSVQPPKTTKEEVVDLLSSLIEIIQSGMNVSAEQPYALFIARLIDVVPLYISLFADEVGKIIGQEALLSILIAISQSQSEILKAAFLHSLVEFDELLEFSELPVNVHNGIVEIIRELIVDAQEDTPALLMTSLKSALSISNQGNPIRQLPTMELMLSIASIDSGNVEVQIELEETLAAFLEEVPSSALPQFLGVVLESILTTINESKGEFSDAVSLSLLVLNAFLSASGSHSQHHEYVLPQNQFNAVFQTITQLLLSTTDEALIQSATDSLISLIYVGYDWTDLGVVLQVLSRLLGPELTDSAVLNLGKLIVVVLEKFGNSSTNAISADMMGQILSATSARLLSSKNTGTLANLLNVLCFVTSLSVEQTLQFLAQQGNIREVLNCWFKNFDLISGAESIMGHCTQLMNIYSYLTVTESEVARTVRSLKVDSDEQINDFPKNVIVTRSMRREMKFTQISVPLRIIKLLVIELQTQIVGQSHDQIQQKEHEHEHEHEHDETCDDQCNNEDNNADFDEDGDWEDVDDDVYDDFDKLKSYINVDQKDDSPEVISLIVHFFKRVANENVAFRGLYEELTEAEKKLLSDNIV